MLYALIGATDWTLETITALTFPQFHKMLAGQGQILYPRLKPHLDAQFAQISSEPLEKGKESDIDRIIREDNEQRAALSRGERPTPTDKQKRRQQAYRILYGVYLGEEKAAVQVRQGKVIPELPQATAQAIVAFVQEGRMPPDIWARDGVPWWLDISATANQGQA